MQASPEADAAAAADMPPTPPAPPPGQLVRQETETVDPCRICREGFAEFACRNCGVRMHVNCFSESQRGSYHTGAFGERVHIKKKKNVCPFCQCACR